MTDARAGAVYLEALASADAEARTGAVYLEVLGDRNDDARIAAVYLEALVPAVSLETGDYGAGDYGEGAYGFTLPEAPECMVELYLDGEWVDVASDVDWPAGVRIERGRSSPTDDIQPGYCRFTLRNAPDDNGVCQWTPDNPLSARWPHWREGVQVRIRAAFHLLSTRFAGWVESVEPSTPGAVTGATVAVTCVDVLGLLARRDLLSDFAERTIDVAAAEIDLWPLNDAGLEGTVRNVGGDQAQGRLVPAVSGAGSVFLGTPEAALFDGCAAFSQGTDHKGPVIVLPLSAGDVRMIGFWCRITPESEVTTSYRDVAGGWQNQDCWWRVTVAEVSGVVQFQLRQGDGTLIDSTTVPGGVADGRWRHITAITYTRPVGPYIWAFLDGLLFAGQPLTDGDAQLITHMVLGGYAAPVNASRATNGAPVEIGTPFVQHTTLSGYGWDEAVPAVSFPERDRMMRFVGYGQPAVGVHLWSISSTGDQLVKVVGNGGRTILEAAREVAATTGGLVDASRTGQFRYRTNRDIRSRTVDVTITAGTDDDATTPPTWRRSGDTRPTRVTATSPAGDVTAIDTAAEATGVRRDATIDTCAATPAQAMSAAESLFAGTGRLALVQLAVDVVTAETDLWDAMWALDLGGRVRYTGLPAGWLGVTYTDAYVLGMSEEITDRAWRFTLDTQPADDPPEAWTDDDVYSRVAAGGTLSLASAVTSSDTTLSIAHTGDPLTTDAGAYPLSLTVDGERITVPSAPAGATSPQTLTGVTRGAAPSTATAHAAGADVELYLAAAVAR